MTGWSYVVSAFDLSWRSPRNGERRIAWSYVIIPFVNWIANCHCIRLVWFLSWYKYLVLYSFTFASQCWIGGGLKFHFSSIFFNHFFCWHKPGKAWCQSQLFSYQCSCNVFIVVAVVLFVVFLWPKIKLVPLMTSPIEFPMRLCELEKLSSRAIFNRIKNGVAAERQFCCQNKKIWLCYFIKHCKIMQFDFSVVKRLLFDV